MMYLPTNGRLLGRTDATMFYLISWRLSFVLSPQSLKKPYGLIPRGGDRRTDNVSHNASREIMDKSKVRELFCFAPEEKTREKKTTYLARKKMTIL